MIFACDFEIIKYDYEVNIGESLDWRLKKASRLWIFQQYLSHLFNPHVLAIIFVIVKLNFLMNDLFNLLIVEWEYNILFSIKLYIK